MANPRIEFPYVPTDGPTRAPHSGSSAGINPPPPVRATDGSALRGITPRRKDYAWPGGAPIPPQPPTLTHPAPRRSAGSYPPSVCRRTDAADAVYLPRALNFRGFPPGGWMRLHILGMCSWLGIPKSTQFPSSPRRRIFDGRPLSALFMPTDSGFCKSLAPAAPRFRCPLFSLSIWSDTPTHSALEERYQIR